MEHTVNSPCHHYTHVQAEPEPYESVLLLGKAVHLSASAYVPTLISIEQSIDVRCCASQAHLDKGIWMGVPGEGRTHSRQRAEQGFKSRPPGFQPPGHTVTRQLEPHL